MDKPPTDESYLAIRTNGTARYGIAKQAIKKPDNATASKNSQDAYANKKTAPRAQYIREETSTHETLKIIDSSLTVPDEENGIDPYNTGGFDRSKSWNNRFRS